MFNARLNRMLPAISVLTHISSDVGQPSLMVHAKNGQRYIFGRMGEGFQRSIVEGPFRSTHLADIFLTGPMTWDSVSGLPGFLLSLHNDHKPGAIHSVSRQSIKSMTDTWRFFVVHNQLAAEPGDADYHDSNLSVQSVILSPSTGAAPSVSYILQMLPTRGRFLAKEAVRLGVPPGPLFRELTMGNSVTTPDGKVVSPEDVLEPAPNPSRVLIVDLPTQEYVGEALEVAWTRQVKRKDPNVSPIPVDITAVFFLCGDSVDLSSSDFAKLVSSFGDNVQHVISHKDYTPDTMMLKRYENLRSVLTGILPEQFGPLAIPSPCKPLPPALIDSGARVMLRGDTFPLGPRTSGSREPVLSDESQSLLTLALPEQALVRDSIQYAGLMRNLDEPEVTTLGTGASSPSPYRNVAGTLVRAPTVSGVVAALFDCGEGTYNSLLRLYGSTGASAVLRELHSVFISHLHADHHLGVLRLIREWIDVHRSDDILLNVLAPVNLWQFICDWASIDGTETELSRVRFIDQETVVIGKGWSTSGSGPVPENAFSNNAISSAGSCRAIHIDRSYSGFLEWKLPSGEPFKVAYSGDTRPNDAFAKIAKGADLLIHEATHDDSLHADAKAKRHSTVREALQVGTMMEAKHVVLTHFSQRYPMMVPIDTLLIEVPTAPGFDGMVTALSDIFRVQEAIPQLAREAAALADQASIPP